MFTTLKMGGATKTAAFHLNPSKFHLCAACRCSLSVQLDVTAANYTRSTISATLPLCRNPSSSSVFPPSSLP